MAQLVTLQDDFSRGMVRDVPRDKLPDGALYTSLNMLPGLGAPLRRRGPWITVATPVSSTRIDGGIYAQFASTAEKHLVVNSSGKLLNLTAGTDLGAAVETYQNPVFHRDKVIIPSTGAAAPKYYDGTTLGTLGGSPPNGKWADVWKDFTLLASPSTEPQRLYFSAAGNPASWTTGSRYWDATHPLVGIKAMRNGILLFSKGHVERLRGTTPPPGGDLILEPLFDVGCVNAKSIAAWGDNVVWASADGLYITNGSALDDVTVSCGMKSRWKEYIDAVTLPRRVGASGFTVSLESVAGNVFGRWYVGSLVVIYTDTLLGTTAYDEVASFAVDLEKRTWWELSNLYAASFWRRDSTDDELYFGNANLSSGGRVGGVSNMFDDTPNVNNGHDAFASGNTVPWTVETAYFMGETGSKRWRSLSVTHDIRNGAGGTDATPAVSYLASPELTSYTSLGSLAKTTAIRKKRFPVGKAAPGLAFKLADAGTTGVAEDVRLYSLEADVHARESSRGY